MFKEIYVPPVKFSATEATLIDLATGSPSELTILDLCHANITVALVELFHIVKPISSFKMKNVPVRIISSKSNDHNFYSVFLAIHKNEKPPLKIATDTDKKYMLHITGIDIIDNESHKLVYREGISIISNYGQILIMDKHLDPNGFIKSSFDFDVRIKYYQENLKDKKVVINDWREIGFI